MPSTRSSDGVELVYHDLGGSGESLLFVHATGFHAMVWRPVAERLLDRYHCWGLDLRGHGDSATPPEGGFEWRRFGDDVLAVVSALGLVRPLAVGHSLGGAALLAAEQEAPGTFAGLYLYEPTVATPDRRASTEGPDMEEISRRRRRRFRSRAEAMANFAAKPPMAAFAAESMAAYVEHGMAEADDGWVELKCRPEDEAQVFAGFARNDIFERYPEVHCPVVLAYGGVMEEVQGPNLGFQARHLRRARVTIVPGLGHLGPMEDPALVASAILAELPIPG